MKQAITVDPVRCRCGTYIDPTKHQSVGGEVVCDNLTCREAALADGLGPKGYEDYKQTRKKILPN